MDSKEVAIVVFHVFTCKSSASEKQPQTPKSWTAFSNVSRKIISCAPRALRQSLAHVHLAAGAVTVAYDDDAVLRLGNALALQVVVAFDGG